MGVGMLSGTVPTWQACCLGRRSHLIGVRATGVDQSELLSVQNWPHHLATCSRNPHFLFSCACIVYLIHAGVSPMTGSEESSTGGVHHSGSAQG